MKINQRVRRHWIIMPKALNKRLPDWLSQSGEWLNHSTISHSLDILDSTVKHLGCSGSPSCCMTSSSSMSDRCGGVPTMRSSIYSITLEHIVPCLINVYKYFKTPQVSSWGLWTLWNGAFDAGAPQYNRSFTTAEHTSVSFFLTQDLTSVKPKFWMISFDFSAS